MFPPFRPRDYRPDIPAPRPLVLPQPKIAAWYDITILADPMSADPALIAVLSLAIPVVRRPELDQWLIGDEFVVLDADAQLISGGLLHDSVTNTVMEANALLLGTYVSGVVIPATSTLLLADAELRVGGILVQSAGLGETVGANWLRWSKIGALNFTQDRSNVAGKMPLPFKGTIYAILRRGTSIIVYAKNGVATLIPRDVAFGYAVLSSVGLKSKLAVVDTGDAHYYVDSKGRLYAIKGAGLELLDYREWLAGLGTVAMAFNPETRLLYIGDGTTGYLYNVDTGSFGKGPATVTGAGIQDGTLYVVASGTMTIPNFANKTDIYDFGTRKMKSIQSLEFGVDTSLVLQAAIDYRHYKSSAFATTSWRTIDRRGQVFIACMGTEFRFLTKATSAGVFHVDSLKVNGVVHAH